MQCKHTCTAVCEESLRYLVPPWLNIDKECGCIDLKKVIWSALEKYNYRPLIKISYLFENIRFLNSLEAEQGHHHRYILMSPCIYLPFTFLLKRLHGGAVIETLPRSALKPRLDPDYSCCLYNSYLLPRDRVGFPGCFSFLINSKTLTRL